MYRLPPQLAQRTMNTWLCLRWTRQVELFLCRLIPFLMISLQALSYWNLMVSLMGICVRRSNLNDSHVRHTTTLDPG